MKNKAKGVVVFLNKEESRLTFELGLAAMECMNTSHLNDGEDLETKMRDRMKPFVLALIEALRKRNIVILYSKKTLKRAGVKPGHPSFFDRLETIEEFMDILNNDFRPLPVDDESHSFDKLYHILEVVQ